MTIEPFGQREWTDVKVRLHTVIRGVAPCISVLGVGRKGYAVSTCSHGRTRTKSHTARQGDIPEPLVLTNDLLAVYRRS